MYTYLLKAKQAGGVHNTFNPLLFRPFFFLHFNHEKSRQYQLISRYTHTQHQPNTAHVHKNFAVIFHRT